MVKLKADFKSDWIAQLRAHMIQLQGWNAAEVASLGDGDIPDYYFESLRRRPAPRARVLKIADDFSCPPTQEAGWRILQDKVRKGEDLSPHLSYRHASLFNNDGLLAEWGVHHFHLGTEPDPKNPSYAKRTGPLVYVLVDDTTFCAINVYSHEAFEEVSIIESIHRNWPDMIEKYRARGVTGATLDKTQRRTLRRKCTNVLVATSDGTVYMPIGGGVMGSSIKMESVIHADRWRSEMQSLQARFEKHLDELMPTFKERGYAGEDEIQGQLRITEAGYQVVFPKYGVLANLQLDPAFLASRAYRYGTNRRAGRIAWYT